MVTHTLLSFNGLVYLNIENCTLIHKKEIWDLSKDFRPVLHVMSKVLESVVQRQLYSYLEIDNLLMSTQFGFRRGSSAVDVVGSLVAEVLCGF